VYDPSVGTLLYACDLIATASIPGDIFSKELICEEADFGQARLDGIAFGKVEQSSAKTRTFAIRRDSNAPNDEVAWLAIKDEGSIQAIPFAREPDFHILENGVEIRIDWLQRSAHTGFEVGVGSPL
jgi:hypothetical protein